MLGNIAVILRGHVRTWHLIYKNVFEFYETIAKNVDYYWFTWDTDKDYMMRNSFIGRNLVAYHTFNNAPFFQNSWRSAAYLNYMALYFIKENNKQKPYDAIIDTRPDVLSELGYGQFKITEPKKVLVTNLEVHNCLKTKKRELAIPDHFIVYPDIELLEKMCSRMYSEADSGNQVELVKLIYKHGYQIQTCQNIESRIIRPNLANYFNIHEPLNTSEVLKKYSEMQHNWMNELTPEEKIKICRNLHVDVNDYDSGDPGRPHSTLARIW
jgi:hypothetical protein